MNNNTLSGKKCTCRLQKSGVRYVSGCPLHEYSTPSSPSVSEQKESHCFCVCCYENKCQYLEDTLPIIKNKKMIDVKKLEELARDKEGDWEMYGYSSGDFGIRALTVDDLAQGKIGIPIKDFIKKLITKEKQRTVDKTKKEIKEKIQEYFNNLVLIPDPQMTKASLIKYLFEE